MSKVTILGSFVVDLITRTKKLPEKGQTIFASDFDMGAGGKGQNQAVQSHLMGCETDFICKVGNDEVSKIGFKFWEDIGFKPKCIVVDGEKTGCANISVDEEGRNQISVFLGANNTFSTQEIMTAMERIGESKYLLMQSEINEEAINLAADLAWRNSVPVIYNPAPYRNLSSDFLKRLLLITPNETEAACLLGWPVVNLENCKIAAQEICKMGPQNVIITLGEAGCCFANQNDVAVYSTFKVSALDTVGAGDSFNGALVAMMASGFSIKNAIPYALAASALSVTSKGSASSMKNLNDVEVFLKMREK